jgi:hypothetical protein
VHECFVVVAVVIDSSSKNLFIGVEKNALTV